MGQGAGGAAAQEKPSLSDKDRGDDPLTQQRLGLGCDVHESTKPHPVGDKRLPGWGSWKLAIGLLK